MATTTAATTAEIQTLYVAYFNRPADPLGLQVLQSSGASQAQLAAGFSASAEFTATYAGKSPLDLVNSIYLNLFGRPAETAGLLFWASRLQAGQETFQSLVLTIAGAAQNEDKIAIDSKVAAATAFTESLTTERELLGYDGDAANAVVKAWLAGINSEDSLAANTTPTALDATAAAAAAARDTVINVPKIFDLTVGTDTLVGSAGNDVFNAVQAAGGVTFTVGDSIDGGLGNDTLNITQTGAFASVLSTSIKNVETINIVSGTTGSVVNSTPWTGTTALNVTAPGAVTVTAAGTTAVTALNGTLGASAVTVNGGANVNVTTITEGTGSSVVVGGTTAATGDVVVNATSNFIDGAGATNTQVATAVTVTGGKTITVTDTLVRGTSNDAGDVLTGGAINVTGSAITTSVSVSQTAAAARSATAGAAIVNGQVVIADVNAASGTAAGTLTSVSINSFGDNSTVNSGALNSLTLSGRGVKLDVTSGALTTPTVNTLALNLQGLTTTGAVTLDNDYSTVNINATTGASTINSLVGTGVTKLNVAGDRAVTLTGTTLAALTDVVVTNSAGFTLGTALAAGTKFTGGAGADTIALTGGFTTAITTGAGNDFVTYAAAGTGGSVDAGAGTDTIAMTAAQAAAASLNSTFNTAFRNFEVLDIATGATTPANAINLAGINGVNSVVTRGVAAGAAVTIDGFTTGGTLTLDGAAGNAATSEVIANVTNATLTANDTFNVRLSNSTNASVAFGKVTLAGIETVNISTIDAGSTANNGATVDTVVLTAADATRVVVTGNNGLNITNTGNSKIVTFDASGVVGDTTTDTAAGLGVTFVSANNTANANVTIIGGAGNDVLTGGAAIDTITGGAGNDTLTGGLGADIINTGVGHDIIVVNSNSDVSAGVAFSDSTTAAFDRVNNFKTVATALNSVDFSTDNAFLTTAAGNANLNLLKLGVVVDDAGVGTGTVQAVTASADATGNGQSVGTTFAVNSGILTLGGAGASAVDTLAEWLAEAAAVAAANGDAIAFQFGADTYVFVQNGNSDILIDLVGVNGATSLTKVGATTTAAAGSILFG